MQFITSKNIFTKQISKKPFILCQGNFNLFLYLGNTLLNDIEILEVL